MSRRGLFDDELELDADRGLDPGPDGLLQRRLPAAGFVRAVENATPTFVLPRPSGPVRRFRACRVCGAFELTADAYCDDCRRYLWRG